MATNDMIAAFGGTSSNFVDVGGSTDHEQLEEIIVLLDSNKNTNVILFNCFGGLLDLNMTAAIIEKVIKRKYLTKPLVLRLRGHNESEAHKRLIALQKEYKELYVINNFTDAVEQAVTLSKRT
jgi:succinyl-CoA synthetase beta subunit